jgi:Protein kinase domain
MAEPGVPRGIGPWLAEKVGRPAMSAEERASYLVTQRELVIERFRRAIPVGLAVSVAVTIVGGTWAPAGTRWRVWLAGSTVTLLVAAILPVLRVPFARAHYHSITMTVGCVGAVACGVLAAESGGFSSPAIGTMLVIWAFGTMLAPPNLLLGAFEFMLDIAVCAFTIACLAPGSGSPSFFLLLNGAGMTMSLIAIEVREHQSMLAFLMRRRLDAANARLSEQRAALAELNDELERRVEVQVAEIRRRARDVEILNAQLQERVVERSRELAAALARLAGKDKTNALGVGSVLNERIEIVRPIGIGAMGQVFEARDRRTATPVAVKVIRAESVHGMAGLQRFLTEARAAAAVLHEGIVRTLDVDVTQEGTIFQVMELLSGITLSQWLAQPDLRDVGAVCEAGRVLAEALAAAHAAGVVHRDIKPANVMVTREPPGIKVLDFGVSKVTSGADDDAAVTRAHAILGTPAYMAPEQLRNPRTAGPAADVYSLGVVLYQALTGARPFEGTGPELLVAHAERVPADPRFRRGEIPEPVSAVVMRCLAKDPAARPPADEVAEGLAPFADAGALRVETERGLAARVDRDGTVPNATQDPADRSPGSAARAS